MIPSGQPEIRNEPEPGLVFRRYRLADGRTVETFELPASVVRAVGLPKLHAAVDAWCRGEAKRAQSAQLLAAITDRLAQGVKPLAIADDLGCSEAYVRQVRARLESGHGAEQGNPRDTKPGSAGRRRTPRRADLAPAVRRVPGL